MSSIEVGVEPGIDSAAQLRITGQPHQQLVVVAGAGSGKTKNLVARVAALVRDDVDPSRIAVITFTEKAARELLHRLRIDEQVSGIDRAYVGTIHGFCRRILRQFPIEAGLPPMFSVNDEITSSAQAATRQTDIVNQVLTVAGGDDDLHQALTVMAEMNKFRDLRYLVAAIDASWDQFEHASLDVPSMADAQSLIATVCADINDIIASSWFNGSGAHDALVGLIQNQVVPQLQRLRTMSLADLAKVDEKVLKLGNSGSPKEWEAQTNLTPKAVRALIKAAFNQVGLIACDITLRRVVAVLAPLVVDAAGERLSDGHVTFDDLLVLTRRLLSEHAHVLSEVRGDLSHLFVDEFQDTDPVQFDIIKALCDSAATKTPVLFAVGDPKQAIYAFRGADVALFNQLADAAQADDSLVKLRANYRTRSNVAQWINATVAKRFAGEGVAFQSPYEDLAATRIAPDNDPGAPITLLGLEADGEIITPPTATDSARQEAADIVSVVSEAIGHWLVGPERDGPARPAKLGDVAILVRTRSGLPILEQALGQAGIAYRIEGGSLVYESREVYELLRVLRAVNDPSNAAKVVAALRTSVCAVSDRDLFEYRSGNPNGNKRGWGLPFSDHFDDGGFAGSRRVFDALRLIGELHARKHTQSPAQLLAELYDTRLGLVVAQFEGEMGQAGTWRRVRFVIDEARQWSDSTGGTLREYLEWVDTRIESVDRSEISTDEGEDSVRILTVHAAKGLQFPVVIVAGLGRGDVNEGASLKAKVIDGRPEIAMGKLRTLKVRSQDDRDRNRAEEARLLYVAMTRAQDHLVVSMYRAVRVHSSVAGRLREHITLNGAATREPAPIADTQPPLSDLSGLAAAIADRPLPVPARPDRSERNIWTPSGLARQLSPHGAGATVMSQVSDIDDVVLMLEDDYIAVPVAAPRLGETDPGKHKDPSNSLQQERSSGRYGTTVGIAVHQVLQLVDLARPEFELEDFVAAACDAADVPLEFRSDVDALARSIIASELFQQLCRASSSQREMYVGTTLKGTGIDITLWGYVDAVFVDEHGELVIVDFKTDTAVASNDELLARYQHQLAGYAIALQKATGLVVRDANLLIGTRSGQPAHNVVASRTVLDRATAEIRAGLATS